MFVILSYDVQASRSARIAKTVKKYLTYMQRSLYQGYLTEKQLHRLQEELLPQIDPEYDSIIVYRLENERNISVDKIGVGKERGAFIF